MNWIVYVLECGDGTFYTGITRNLDKRLQAHTEGKGARYTRGRNPLRLVYYETQPDKGAAQKREMAIKKMSRREKMTLVLDR